VKALLEDLLVMIRDEDLLETVYYGCAAGRLKVGIDPYRLILNDLMDLLQIICDL